MDPTLYQAFAEEFVAEWNRSQGDAAAEQAAREAELQRVRHQTEPLVDAIVNGTPAVGLNARLQQFEARRLQLEAELSQDLPEVPCLHPALPEIYRANTNGVRPRPFSKATQGSAHRSASQLDPFKAKP